MSVKRTTLLKRRKIAIIVTAIAVAVLAVALYFVWDFVKSVKVEDPADGSIYYIREKDDVYALYDKDKKTVMPTDEEFGYYITHADTLIDVDSETGEYEIIAVVDTEGNEVVGFNQRLLMFPHTEKKYIRQLDVYNQNGSFTFVRMNPDTGKIDDSADFIIKSSPLTVYDQELFASLYVSAGYTLTTRKIQDPIKDDNGEFSEYGLVAERRVREITDEKGEFVLDSQGGYTYEEYDYVPAYYVLTDTSGNKHKVIVGDKMVTGGGYYVQYVDMSGETEVKRDAVYVLSADIGDTLLAPVEDFVTPSITYPMTMNTYFDVEKFVVLKKDTTAENDYKAVVGFDYIDLAVRENTMEVNIPYVFLKDFELAGYMASNDNINACLQALYQPSFVEVKKLSPTIDDLVKYGIAFEDGVDEEGEKKYDLLPEYSISFNYDALDDKGNVIETINNFIYISAPNEAGNYYVYTDIYSTKDSGAQKELMYSLDMVVEVAGHSLEFLNWDRYDWINSSYVNLNIAYCDKITINDHTTGYNATFDLDNSASDMTENVNSSDLIIHATDSNGNETTTFAKLEVTDESGNRWVITATEIKCYSSVGNELKIKSAYYDYNVMGKQVRVNSGEIKCSDGRRVTVNADTIEIRGTENTTIVRYDTSLFRSFYQTLLWASIADSYIVTDEEEAAIVTDENLLLTMTVNDTKGNEFVYRYYRLTSRKAYITVNGNGGFYVLTNRVEKFVSDAQRFFAYELIDATAKR